MTATDSGKRFKAVFVDTIASLSSVDVVPGQYIIIKSTGEVYTDTPETTSQRMKIGGKSSREFNILLSSDSWTQSGTEYIQRPEYSTDIFDGATYDSNISIIVMENTNGIPSDINCRTAVVDTSTVLEFYTDIVPTVDVVMKIIRLA